LISETDKSIRTTVANQGKAARRKNAKQSTSNHVAKGGERGRCRMTEQLAYYFKGNAARFNAKRKSTQLVLTEASSQGICSLRQKVIK